ncbi:MAG: hypothetical protein QM791_09675 [Ferruginibacter sp.]
MSIKKDAAKKTLKEEIGAILMVSVASLKDKLGEKKFEKRIKKAAKLLTEGIKDTSSKKKEAVKKKATKRKPVTAK